MTSRFNEIVVDCHDPQRLATFWREVLRYDVVYDSPEYVTIAPWDLAHAPSAEAIRSAVQPPALQFLKVSEEKVVKNRLHLDLSPIDCTQDEEVQRVLGLGAHHVDIGQGEQSWVVLADPEGNEFCIMRSLA